MSAVCSLLRSRALTVISQHTIKAQQRRLASTRCTNLLSRPLTAYTVLHRYASNEANANAQKQPSEERGRGAAERMEFQAESRKFLDIVAKSLYSDREVFIRELISNASDALERMRYLQVTGQLKSGVLLNDSGALSREPKYEIHLKTDTARNTLTIYDTGVGMGRDEMKKNLGIIARSGTSEFMKQVSSGSGADQKAAAAETNSNSGQNLIGQFGVGFYSTFMVADRVEVFSQSQHGTDRRASRWWSDGASYFEISDAENVQPGTKIVMHLRQNCSEFSREEVVRNIISRFSQFVSFPVYLNGTRVNTVEALWMRDGPINEKEHDDFYKYLGGVDKPMYAITYKTDAPINIRALLYVPSYKPSLFEMSREEIGVALYCRKVLIMPRANNVLPKWMRFLRGVIDSEDIPLNLSRELLQNSALLQRIQLVLTTRVVRFFADQAKSTREDVVKNYDRFLENFGVFLREGMVTSQDVSMREQIARLLKFESSKLPSSTRTTLPEYVERMKAGERTIYFAPAANRQLAESSAYFGAFTKRNQDTEVLYLYEPYDELVFMQLGSFDGKQFRSIENALGDFKDEADTSAASSESMTQVEADELTGWLKTTLGDRISKARMTNKLTTSHPCAISVPELGMFRHLLRTELANRPIEEKYKVLQAVFEVNTSHPLVKKLLQLRLKDEPLAKLLALQLFDNSMIAAGLLDDPKQMLGRLNDLLTQLVKS